uniref:Ig-like domain-containing protein n=1 Tax=Macrostomum lignano TaxID=282301 RepID=A0A1I8FKV4_9PLAT
VDEVANEAARQAAVARLASSEEAFALGLAACRQFYADRLAEFLTPDEHRAMFFNLEDLLEASCSFAEPHQAVAESARPGGQRRPDLPGPAVPAVRPVSGLCRQFECHGAAPPARACWPPVLRRGRAAHGADQPPRRRRCRALRRCLTEPVRHLRRLAAIFRDLLEATPPAHYDHIVDPGLHGAEEDDEDDYENFEDEDGRYKDYVNAGNKDYKEFKDSGLEEADAAMSPTARSLVASSSGVSSADPSAAELQQQRRRHSQWCGTNSSQQQPSQQLRSTSSRSTVSRRFCPATSSGTVATAASCPPPSAPTPCCCPTCSSWRPHRREDAAAAGPILSQPLRLVECCSAQFDFAQNPRLLCLSFAGGRTLLLEAPSGEAKQLLKVPDLRFPSETAHPSPSAPECRIPLASPTAMDEELVSEGARLRLSCRITGRPPPRVSWLFKRSANGRPAGEIRHRLGPGAGEFWLDLPAVRRGDAGVYSVVAENCEGRVESRCHVRVAATYDTSGGGRGTLSSSYEH